MTGHHLSGTPRRCADSSYRPAHLKGLVRRAARRDQHCSRPPSLRPWPSIREWAGTGSQAQRCNVAAGASVARLPEPRPRSVTQVAEPRCNAPTGAAPHVSCRFSNFFATLVFLSGRRRGKTPANRHNALVAQWIEHRFPKPGVAGSIPAGGTTLMLHSALSCWGVRRALLPIRQDCRTFCRRDSVAATRRCSPSPFRGRSIRGRFESVYCRTASLYDALEGAGFPTGRPRPNSGEDRLSDHPVPGEALTANARVIECDLGAVQQRSVRIMAYYHLSTATCCKEGRRAGAARRHSRPAVRGLSRNRVRVGSRCPGAARAVLLLARRPIGDTIAGHWELPGGEVEVGESPEGCWLPISVRSAA